MRALEVWHKRRAPVLRAILPATLRPCSRTARPDSSSTVGSPERSTLTAFAIASRVALPGCGTAGTGAMPDASFQAVSAGKIRVAIWPGGVRAAAIASAPSRATDAASGDVLTHDENGRAAPSMSDVSGAS